MTTVVVVFVRAPRGERVLHNENIGTQIAPTTPNEWVKLQQRLSQYL